MLKAGLFHGIYEFTCKYRLADPADRHNRLGRDIIVAAHGCRKISEIFAGHVYRVGQTMATCGQNIGAGEVARVKRA